MLKHRLSIAIFFITTLILVLGPFSWVFIHSACFGRQEILNTAKAIASSESNTSIIISKIAEWQIEHMTYDTRQVYFCPVPPFLLCRIPHPDPTWVMSTKRGGCEEYAILFTDMVRSLGIQSRIVYNLGEDHVWSEVLINGSWIHVDGKRFNDTGFYERPKDGGGWGKQLSYVFFVGSDNKQYDITHRCTNTGMLIVKVEKGGLPVENARVIINSRFLMETDPNYKEPRFCLEKYTNKSGVCTCNLGGDNYTIIAESGTVFGYRGQVIVHLNENDITSVTLHLTEFSLLLSIEEIASTLLIVLIVSLLLATGFVAIHKKWCFLCAERRDPPVEAVSVPLKSTP